VAFRSEGELRAWLVAKGHTFGAIAAPQTLYDLAREWYAGRLDVEFEPLSAAHKQRLFDKYGLRGEFWAIGG
jgi:hypothetical protein